MRITRNRPAGSRRGNPSAMLSAGPRALLATLVPMLAAGLLAATVPATAQVSTPAPALAAGQAGNAAGQAGNAAAQAGNAAGQAGNAVPETVSLDGNDWRMKGYPIGAGVKDGAQDPGLDDSSWYKVTVPGTANGSLADLGVTQNPLVSGSTGWQYVGTEEWWYRTTFTAPASWAASLVRVNVEGAMDEADVYVNGDLIGSTDGMYDDEYLTIPSADLSVTSPNVLAIRTYPDSRGFNSRPSVYANDGSWLGLQYYKTIRTVGLWRPVSLLVTSRAAYIPATFVHTAGTLSASSTSATLVVRQSVDNTTSSTQDLSIGWSLAGDDFRLAPLTGTVPVTAPPGVSVVSYDIAVSGAALHLWWPNGYGTNLPDGNRYLYKLTTTLTGGGIVLDHAVTGSIGIRSLSYRQTTGAAATDNPLVYVVNSEPVYAQGAGWVPADALYRSDVEDQAYQRDLLLAFEGGVTFLRVWGGGVVEQPEFYQLASKYGIMIEQEFWNFGPSTYTVSEPLWADNADSIVKDLRNYPALASWSGGNELAGYYTGDGAEAETYPWVQAVQQAVDSYDGTRLFLPTDPSGGECHQWGYLHLIGSQGYESTGNTSCDFLSEFGIASAPDTSVLASYEGSNTSDVYRDVTNGSSGDLLSPNEFGTYLSNAELEQRTQLAQAIDVSYVTGYEKAQKWHTSGALVWEYNDMAPYVGWSVVASDGQPKAAYYYLKRQWAPISVQVSYATPALSPGQTFTPTLSVINDTDKTLTGYRLAVTEETMDGHQLARTVRDVSVTDNADGGVTSVTGDSFKAPSVPEVFVLVADVISPAGKRVARQAALLTTEPNRSFYTLGAQSDPSELRMTQAIRNGRRLVTVRDAGPSVAYAVELNVTGGDHTSDNYFTLLSGESETVSVENAAGGMGTGKVTVTEAAAPTVRSSDLALGMPAYGSQDDYTAGSGGGPASRDALYATDGGADYTSEANYSTWVADTTGPASLTVDLGKVTSIQQVNIDWGAGYGTSYAIQVSDNDSAWQTVATVSNNAGGWVGTQFPAVRARWVRMAGTASSSAYDLEEISVYRTPHAPPDCAQVPGAIEFEDLTTFDVSTSNAVRGHVSGDPALSGCGADLIKPTGSGASVTYQVGVAGGYYEVYVGTGTSPGGGIVQASVNGTDAGQPIDTYAPSAGAARTDIGPEYLSGTATLTFTLTGQDAASSGDDVALDYVQFVPIARTAGDFWEAESLTPTTVDGSAAVFADPNMSGGAGTKFTPTEIGGSMTYTIDVPAAGTFDLVIGQKDQAARGIMQVSVDGTDIGAPIDQYRLNNTYLASDVGTITLSAGEHTVTFTVVGMDAESLGDTLALDFIWLDPAG